MTQGGWEFLASPKGSGSLLAREARYGRSSKDTRGRLSELGADVMLAIIPNVSCLHRFKGFQVIEPQVGSTSRERARQREPEEERAPFSERSAGVCKAFRPGISEPWQSLLDNSAFARASIASALATAMGSGPQSQELRARACGFLAQALTPLLAYTAGAGVVGEGVVVTAFCPFPLGCVAEFGAKSLGLNEFAPIPELSLQELQRGLLVATFAQGSLGLLRICLGDFFSGAYTLLLATLGYNSRHPGPSSNWLKTYVLISFINGTMGHIDLIQNMLLQNFPAVAAGLPLSVNLMHMVQIAIPGVSFCGAYFGWQHLKAQRKVLVEAYQRDLALLMEQTPWPPPPLLPYPPPGMAPMPGLPMQGHPAQLQLKNQRSNCEGCQSGQCQQRMPAAPAVGAGTPLESVPEGGSEEEPESEV